MYPTNAHTINAPATTVYASAIRATQATVLSRQPKERSLRPLGSAPDGIHSVPAWFRGDDVKQRARITKALAKKSFASLGTVSPAGYPHSAGVVYDAVGTTLYVHMMRDSRKARNIIANGRVAATVPVRTLPVGPPNTIHFQADATVLELSDPEITQLVAAKKLRKTSGHGAMDEAGAVYIRITPRRRIHTYGIGVSTLALIKDPLHVGARSVDV